MQRPLLIAITGTIIALILIVVYFCWKNHGNEKKQEGEEDEALLLRNQMNRLKGSKRLLAKASSSERPAALFRKCIRPTLFGRYRHTGQWFLCRVRSYDIDGTFTVVWEDGTLQIGCRKEELLRPATTTLIDLIETELDLSSKTTTTTTTTSSSSPLSRLKEEDYDTTNTDTYDDTITVWEAAKRGDLETTLRIIDRGDATPNDVELLEDEEDKTTAAATAASEKEQQPHGTTTTTRTNKNEGRTPLYWACFGGHVELVRELLARGGTDFDGSAYYAITSREKADDERDLLFNPDDGIFSDGVDYDAATTTATTTTTAESNNKKEDDRELIRAMLVATKVVQSSSSSRFLFHHHLANNRNTTKHNTNLFLPTRLYKQEEENNNNKDDANKCVICLERPADAIPAPCGHNAFCVTCLTIVRDNRDGCPICRARIITIIRRHNINTTSTNTNTTTTATTTEQQKRQP